MLEYVLYNVLYSDLLYTTSTINQTISISTKMPFQQLPSEDGNLSQFHSESTAINIGLELQFMS